MPVYPDTEPPSIAVTCTIDQNGFVERKITLYSHTGTHIDAPAHIISGARTLDRIPVNHFVGKAFVLDVRSVEGLKINVFDLKPHEHLIERNEFLLLHTGRDDLWGEPGYFDGYPVLTDDAAEWLGRFELKGLGVDAISLDPPDSRVFPVHRCLLERGMVLIENLTNLQELPATGFMFACLPLNLEGGDGSPVRAVAIIEQEFSM